VAYLSQSYYNELLNRVKELKKEFHTFADIADKLNQEGWLPPKRQKVFTPNMIGTLLRRAGMRTEGKPRSSQVKRRQHEWTFRELSQKLNIPEPTLYAWMQKNILTVRRAEEELYNDIWLIKADEKELKRLQSLRNQPKAWIYHSRVKKVH
jgi:DNA-directed RNA polymerase specialized sigma24 family protein